MIYSENVVGIYSTNVGLANPFTISTAARSGIRCSTALSTGIFGCIGMRSSARALRTFPFPVLKSMSSTLLLLARSAAACSASSCCNRRNAAARS